MIRDDLLTFLTELDEQLDEGLHSSEALVAKAVAALQSDIVADTPEDAAWLAREVRQLEKRHQVDLRQEQ